MNCKILTTIITTTIIQIKCIFRREIMDVIVEKLVNSYKENVNAALAENETSEEHSEVLRDKFVAAFRSNIEIGLAAVFGKVETVNKSPATPLTEVTVEDALRNGNNIVILKLIFLSFGLLLSVEKVMDIIYKIFDYNLLL